MLRLAGSLYGKIADLRNALYARGVLRSHSLGARTISIGNITTGGTGKTPLVAYVAEIVAEAGETVCILTRGYGRKSSGRVLVSDGERVLVDAATGGDEPVELGRKLIGKAIIVADADRVAAAAWAKERFGVTVFVLDDGFQHRRARRDLDIVCIDATDPCGGGRMLPAGRLREPFANLKRADAIVLTRSNLVDSTDDVVERLRRRNARAPIFTCDFRIRTANELSDFLSGRRTVTVETPASQFAFCALGNPEAFVKVLGVSGIEIAGSKNFQDHHVYTQTDADAVEREARASGSRSLITTAKDAVKLKGLKFGLPVYVAELELEMSDEPAFRQLISSS